MSKIGEKFSQMTTEVLEAARLQQKSFKCPLLKPDWVLSSRVFSMEKGRDRVECVFTMIG